MSLLGALQHIYTSSAKGYGGFQTVAVSDDLSSQEILTLERLGDYPTSIGLGQSEPPKVVRCTKLNNDRVAICRTVFLPKDFAGRPGSYLAHSLVFELGDLAKVKFNVTAVLAARGLFVESEPSERLLPPLDVALPDSDRTCEAIPPEAARLLGSLLASIIVACSSGPGVLVVASLQSSVAPLLGHILGLLPPWLRPVCSFSTLVLNPSVETKSYRLMFSTDEYWEPTAESDKFVAFHLSLNKVPSSVAHSTWAQVMAGFAESGRWERAEELADLHWRYGKQDPVRMAELLAQLYRAEEQFGTGTNTAAVAWFSSAMLIPYPETRNELAREYLPRFFNALVERKDPENLLQLLESVVAARNQVGAQVTIQDLPRFWSDTSFEGLVRTPDAWPRVLACRLIIATMDEGVRQSVFDAVAQLVGSATASDSDVAARAVVSSAKRSGTEMVSMLRALVEFLVRRFANGPVNPDALVEFLRQAELLPAYFETAVTVIVKTKLPTERYSAWIVALLGCARGQQRPALIGRALERFVDAGEEDMRRVGLARMFDSIGWQECREIARAFDQRYKGGKLLDTPRQGGFLGLRKGPQEPRSAGRVAFDNISQWLSETIEVKRKARDARI